MGRSLGYEPTNREREFAAKGARLFLRNLHGAVAVTDEHGTTESGTREPRLHLVLAATAGTRFIRAGGCR
jgi:hypothetical protein